MCISLTERFDFKGDQREGDLVLKLHHLFVRLGDILKQTPKQTPTEDNGNALMAYMYLWAMHLLLELLLLWLQLHQGVNPTLVHHYDTTYQLWHITYAIGDMTAKDVSCGVIDTS